ncbi:hypothetical protein CEUSTIGMA_g4393.t1 [Chlamydomonas eustigma]|uniref:Uncharacterized protein n=1 Tax=Chlamydomonas eustigma TaxID=1157962 RepID=A0A250X1L4_9CHLO|nr:hypothetical protein CEUSTIGMA_g4393.t1 [Chlamydomonas eustigma]|eukprot:GAX76946.1 hypothetical protein CEUSTIGMA_g4393.t1 [Chlamydomonas eustigma]
MSKMGYGWPKHVLLDENEPDESQSFIPSSPDFAPKTPATIKYSIRGHEHDAQSTHVLNTLTNNLFRETEQNESRKATIAFEASNGNAFPSTSMEAQTSVAKAEYLTPPQDPVQNTTSRPHVPGKNLQYTSKYIGDPPVWELDPSTPSQQIRLKHRASTLIQRYAGSRWREAQRTGWMIDVVLHIDKDYREYVLDQAHHIHYLQEQVLLMQQNQSASSQDAQSKIADLGATARRLDAELRDSKQVVLDLQTRLGKAEAALRSSEQAASLAASQCSEMDQAVQILAQREAATRKNMALRSHQLKEGLRHSEGKARALSEAQRRQKLEVQAMKKVHKEQLDIDRAALEQHYASQLQAVHDVEKATAQMQVERMRLELDAYKEPWIYLHGKRCPTGNAVVAKRLGLTMTSLNTLHVPP